MKIHCMKIHWMKIHHMKIHWMKIHWMNTIWRWRYTELRYTEWCISDLFGRGFLSSLPRKRKRIRWPDRHRDRVGKDPIRIHRYLQKREQSFKKPVEYLFYTAWRVQSENKFIRRSLVKTKSMGRAKGRYPTELTLHIGATPTLTLLCFHAKHHSLWPICLPALHF